MSSKFSIDKLRQMVQADDAGREEENDYNDDISISDTKESGDEEKEDMSSNAVDLDPGALYDEDVKEQGILLTEFFSSALKAAQTQMLEVKRRLQNEKKKELQVRDTFYTDQMRKQQSVVNQLSANLAITEKHNERNLGRFDIIADRLSILTINTKKRFAWKHSCLRIFHTLKDHMLQQRRYNLIIKLCSSTRRKMTLSSCFMKLCKEGVKNILEKKKAAEDIQHDVLVKEIIKKYELKLGGMRAELEEAYAITRQEQLRRQQLEEDLRRTFLKNMTNLNMEALNIFQSSFDVQKESEAHQPVIALKKGVSLDEGEFPRAGPPKPLVI